MGFLFINNHENKMSKDIKGAAYTELLGTIKTRIAGAQYEALKAVNKELISLYWDVGRAIMERQQSAAGSKLIQQQTNAKYMVMDADVPLVQSGGKTDFHYANDASIYFPPTSVDKILHDGDQVKLGGIVLTAHLTAGHTKGCTTWSMQVTDHGKQ
jgi:hypothetical protein